MINVKSSITRGLKSDIADMLGISKRTVYKAFKLLDKLELIKQERQGLNKPNRIYIGKTNADFSGNCNICRSEPAECAGQDVQNMQGSDTDFNDTEISETDKTYMEPYNSSAAMREFLLLYKTNANEDHQPVERKVFNKADDMMQRVVNENGIEYLIDGLINYFDTAKVDRPRLDYFVKVAPRYFDTQFYDIIGD